MESTQQYVPYRPKNFYERFLERKLYDFPKSLINNGLIKSFDYDVMVEKLENLFSRVERDVSYSQIGVYN